jgi:hypothetical protein
LRFLTHLFHFVFWNGIAKFLKKEIPRIQNKDVFAILFQFLYPCSSSGQTADPVSLVSGWTGINLTIQIIAIKNGERPCLLLGMGRQSKEDQQRSQQKKDSPKPLGFHSLHLLNKSKYIPSVL